ncbi:MAG: protein phosphatase CheZ [Pseudomonadota bacterium]
MAREIGINAELISLAKDLVKHLEEGDTEAATGLIDELARVRETELFQQIGKLTRELHNAITEFDYDQRLSDFAHHEMPDAKERLNYVISMTNQAANRTLTAIEAAMPICETLYAESSGLNMQWQRFTKREMSVGEFREVSKTLRKYLQDSEAQLGQLKSHMNDILMAQEFQDLTGQIINKVIKMVEDVENHLVNLIRVAGIGVTTQKQENNEELAGPQVPNLSSASAVRGQDEVDELLSSLGF